MLLLKGRDNPPKRNSCFDVLKVAYIGILRLVIIKKTNIIFPQFDTLCDHSDEKKTVVLGSSMQKNCNICGQDFSKSSESISMKFGRHNRMDILQILSYYYVRANINYGFMVNKPEKDCRTQKI